MQGKKQQQGRRITPFENADGKYRGMRCECSYEAMTGDSARDLSLCAQHLCVQPAVIPVPETNDTGAAVLGVFGIQLDDLEKLPAGGARSLRTLELGISLQMMETRDVFRGCREALQAVRRRFAALYEANADYERQLIAEGMAGAAALKAELAGMQGHEDIVAEQEAAEVAEEKGSES